VINGLPNVQAASQFSGQSILTSIFAIIAVFTSIWRLPNPMLWIPTLAIGIVTGLIISIVFTKRQLKSIDEKGEYKFLISPAFLLIAFLIMLVILAYFTKGYMSSPLVGFFALFFYPQVPASNITSVFLYKQWERKNNRKLLADADLSTIKIYAVPPVS
jgi:hypothetical protein